MSGRKAQDRIGTSRGIRMEGLWVPDTHYLLQAFYSSPLCVASHYVRVRGALG